MELDWTTFALELINFLVLIWILNRFLYQPVMNVIVQRRAAIQKTLSDAEAVRGKAQALQAHYENRLSEWELEREKARAQLHEELTAERARLLDNLRDELIHEREKAAAVDQRRMREFMQQAESTAIAQGRTFARRLLSRLSGPELEGKIVDLVLEDLQHVPDKQSQDIRAVPASDRVSMKIASAYSLGQGKQADLCHACRTLAGREVACEFVQDSTLISGVRISFGPWVLRANVQDELAFFAEPLRHA